VINREWDTDGGVSGVPNLHKGHILHQGVHHFTYSVKGRGPKKERKRGGRKTSAGIGGGKTLKKSDPINTEPCVSVWSLVVMTKAGEAPAVIWGRGEK